MACLAYLACLVFLVLGASAQSASDLAGMQAFFNALTTPEVLPDWDFSNTDNACTWTGVTCSGGFVTRLIFTNLGLEGNFSLAGNLSQMTHLQQFSIAGSATATGLSGTVPPEIYQMRSLQQLNLQYNALTGTFPTSLMGMPQLQKIYFSNNGFSGPLPSDVAGLNKTMNYFSAANCGATGPIPDGYGTLTLLQSFLVNVNKLSGTIPSSLGNLVNVQVMKLGSNTLVGSIPDTFGNLRSVLQLHLYSNQLSGTVPASLGNLLAVEELFMYSNTNLGGIIPDSFTALTALTSLQLQKTAISGSIPQNIGNLVNLQTFSAYQCKLQGSIPLSIEGLVNLVELQLYSSATQSVSSPQNTLRGSIPAGLGKLTNLNIISIAGNQFTGAFPSFWQTQPSAQLFDVTRNCWDSSSVPSYLGSKYTSSTFCTLNVCNDKMCTAAENCTTCPGDCLAPCVPILKTAACNETVNGGCDPLTQCVDTTYSIYCTPCPSGYSGAGLTGCVDINECTTNDAAYADQCVAPATCVNQPGTYTCNCPSTTTKNGDGFSCDDINECAINNGGCSSFRSCINLDKTGSYCGNCSDTRIPIGNTSCSELNPCASSNLNECNQNALCTPSDDLSTYTCQCKVGYTGDGKTCDVDTDYVKKHHTFDKGLSGGLGAVVGVGVIIGVFAAVMLGMFWSNFARHGAFYCGIIIAGVFLSFVSALTVLPHHSDELCIAMPWFLGVAFVLVYGCLFIKTWALYKVWRNATNFKKTTLTPFYIIKLLGCELAVEVAFLIIWTAVDPPKVHYRKMVDDTYSPACQSDSDAWWAVFLTVKGAWLLFGAVLSVLTRDVAKEYNESSSIAYATYNNVVLAVIAVPLALVLRNVPGGVEIIEVAIIVLAFTFTMCILFFEIWYRIFFPDKNIVESKLSQRSGANNSSASTTARTATSARATQSSHSEADSASAGVV
jgi:hypothetical protein